MADNNKTDSDIIDVTPEKVAEEEKPATDGAGDSGHSTNGKTNGQAKKRRNPWWVLAPMFLLGALLVLGVAFSQDLIAWYKGNPTPPNSYLAPSNEEPVTGQQGAEESGAMAALESQLVALQARVEVLEAAPDIAGL